MRINIQHRRRLERNWGISRDYVANFVAIATNIHPSIYNMLKSHQKNRGDQEPQFEFTEGWFRNSGLYGLSEKRQKQFFDIFWSLSKEEREKPSKEKKEFPLVLKARDNLETILRTELYPATFSAINNVW